MEGNCFIVSWWFLPYINMNPGEGNGNPLQYSYLENSVDRGAWWAAVRGVTQSWTQLRRLSMDAYIGDNSLQCSCLENPRDGGAWWAAVYGVAQSRTRLKQLSSSSSSRLKQESYGHTNKAFSQHCLSFTGKKERNLCKQLFMDVFAQKFMQQMYLLNAIW